MRPRTLASIASVVIASVVIASVVTSGLVVASAATLGTVSSSLFAASGAVTYPSGARSVSDLVLVTAGNPRTVTGVTITVTGSSLSALSGQAYTVALLDSSGAQLTNLTGTLTPGGNLTLGGSSATISLAVSGSPLASTFAAWTAFIAGVEALGPSADSTQRVVTLGNGTVAVPAAPVDWKSTLVPNSGANANTAISSVVLNTATTVQQCITVTITGTSATPAPWSFTLDYSQPPYYGTAPSVDSHALVVGNTGGVLTLGGTGTGSGAWQEYGNNTLMTSAGTLSILICQYSAGTAPDEPQAYAVSGQSHGTWTSSQACIRKTVTGNGLYPFYFGWSVTLDMTDAIAQLKATDVGAPRSLVYQPNTLTPAFAPTTMSYTVTNTRDTAVSGTGSYIVELCLSRY